MLCKIFHIVQTTKQLKRRLESSLLSTIREGFCTSRLAEIYNKRIARSGDDNQKVGHISIVESGGQATISGSGEIFEKFIETGLIQNLSGNGQKPVNFYEAGFKTAPIRVINFDETFYGMHYDCRDSKHDLFKLSTRVSH